MTHSNLLSEKELIRLIVLGDIAAKKSLYCQYAGYLVGVCARYISDYEEVKDVIQEAFSRYSLRSTSLTTGVKDLSSDG